MLARGANARGGKRESSGGRRRAVLRRHIAEVWRVGTGAQKARRRPRECKMVSGTGAEAGSVCRTAVVQLEAVRMLYDGNANFRRVDRVPAQRELARAALCRGGLALLELIAATNVAETGAPGSPQASPQYPLSTLSPGAGAASAGAPSPGAAGSGAAASPTGAAASPAGAGNDSRKVLSKLRGSASKELAAACKALEEQGDVVGRAACLRMQARLALESATVPAGGEPDQLALGQAAQQAHALLRQADSLAPESSSALGEASASAVRAALSRLAPSRAAADHAGAEAARRGDALFQLLTTKAGELGQSGGWVALGSVAALAASLSGPDARKLSDTEALEIVVQATGSPGSGLSLGQFFSWWTRAESTRPA